MSKPPECKHCNKPATIHLTQIVNNQIKKLDFCEDCPYQKMVSDPEGFSLAKLLSQGPMPFGSEEGQPSGSGGMVCSHCGFTPDDFKKTHRLGCPDCYEELSDFIDPMLTNMQRDRQHRGKAPAGLMSEIAQKRQLDDLAAQLAQAIEQERYEDAASLRDQMASLRARKQNASNCD